MKKFSTVAFLGIAGLGLHAGQASALWPFSNHAPGCDKCGMTLHCRQYNAFSPFCCDTACYSGGHACLQGCAPFAGGPWGYAQGGHDGHVISGGSTTTGETTTDPAKPSGTSSGGDAPKFTAPMPTPAPRPPSPPPGPATQAPMPFPNAFYRPVANMPYHPGYAPQMGYAPQYPQFAPQYPQMGYGPQYPQMGMGYAPPYPQMGYGPQMAPYGGMPFGAPGNGMPGGR
jgi:hypothetical protein